MRLRMHVKVAGRRMGAVLEIPAAREPVEGETVVFGPYQFAVWGIAWEPDGAHLHVQPPKLGATVEELRASGWELEK